MKKKIINVLKYLWIGAIVVFVSIYLYKKHTQIFDILKYIPPINILLAIIALIVSKTLLSYVSLLSTKYFSENFSFKEMFNIYNITQLAKYIPGSIWHFVGKAGFYASKNMTPTNIKKSIFVEMCWVIFSASFLGIVFILTAEQYNSKAIFSCIKQYIIIYSIVAFIAFIGIYLFRKKLIDILKIITKSPIINIKMAITLLAVWLLLGWCFYITLIPYLKNNSFYAFFYIVGLYSLAYSVGFLVPFAPAGIGIRETVLVVGSSAILNSDKALVLASLNRVIYIIVEILIVVILLSIKRILKNKTI
jgi:uncharacterized membrane protein YbhN (UPF0104 family)